MHEMGGNRDEEKGIGTNAIKTNCEKKLKMFKSEI